MFGTQRAWTAQEIAYLVDNYGKTRPAEIRGTLGRSQIAIQRMAARLGLVSHATQAIASVQHHYFGSINTDLKAYILGLLAADGCVYDNAMIRLVLHRKDRALVELVRDELVPAARIHDRGSAAVSVCFTSNYMASHLARYGVVPRKSYTYDWPHALPQARQRAFLLGYFDGDGSITFRTTKYGKVQPQWYLYGLLGFLATAAAVIERETGVRVSGPTPDPRKTTLHRITSSCDNARAIDAWLHQDDLGLRRKHIV